MGDDTNPPDILEQCQLAIGYRFAQPDLLKAGLTHSSGADSRLGSNERLEFLGDAVLGLVVCDQLYRTFPEAEEGELTKIKSVVVSRRTCARIGRDLRLDQFVIMGKGMSGHQVPVPSGILADLFEGLVGAIYLDGGLEAARVFILQYMGPEIDQVAEGAHGGNYKSQLQHLAQKRFGATPIYHLLDEKGPDHSKCFKIAAFIASHPYPAAWGRNKKEAEQKAAMNALYLLNGDPVPFPGD